MDQLNLERLGIPTVTVVTSSFMDLARATAMAEGFQEACLLQVPHPMGMISQGHIGKKAEEAFPEILRLATDWQPSGPDVETVRQPYPAEDLQFTGTLEQMQGFFLERGWSLGLPVLPPTPARVAGLLKGTTRQPDEVLGEVPPRMGILTVELTAVHAAMAGCRPEYMPLLIAALEAFLTPETNWRGALSMTGTTQSLIMANGPVVRKIGVACEQGAAGNGHQANAAMGYAVNLIAFTVGGSRPPSIDRSTLASPSDFVCWIFGENEQALPSGWEPLHVERGFRRSDSVVTVMCSYPPIENIDHWSISTDEHLRWWRYIVGPMHNMGGPCLVRVMEQYPILALGPEHARLIASAGWSKDDLRRTFWERTRMPLAAWPAGHPESERLAEKLGPLSADTPVPIILSPDQLLIVIAGGDGKQSHFFPPFPGSFPVSRLVGT